MFDRRSKIAVILLNWNGIHDTLECLRSLATISSPSFQTLVVDNGSTDSSVDILQKCYPDLPILQTGKNLGFAEGNNRGINWALENGFEWMFLLNNDTIVESKTLQAFIEATQKRPEAKILGAKILRYDRPDEIDHLGGFWDKEKGEFFSHFQGEKESSFLPMQEVDYVCGAAFFFHRSVPEAIGLFESQFFLFWEESDYCCRAKKRGFSIWTAPESRVWHKISASFQNKAHTHYFWWRGRLLWIERNCSLEEKKRVYRTIIWPSLRKMAKHYVLKKILSFFSNCPEKKEQVFRLKAGCYGALDFLFSRFGNCPLWLQRVPPRKEGD